MPNPFRNDFNVVTTSKLAETYQLSIYNIQGKLMAERNGQLNFGENIIEINQLSTAPSGYYLIKLITPTNSFTDKLIKQ